MQLKKHDTADNHFERAYTLTSRKDLANTEIHKKSAMGLIDSLRLQARTNPDRFSEFENQADNVEREFRRLEAPADSRQN